MPTPALRDSNRSFRFIPVRVRDRVDGSAIQRRRDADAPGGFYLGVERVGSALSQDVEVGECSPTDGWFSTAVAGAGCEHVEVLSGSLPEPHRDASLDTRHRSRPKI